MPHTYLLSVTPYYTVTNTVKVKAIVLLIGLTKDTANDHVSDSPVKEKAEQDGMYIQAYTASAPGISQLTPP